MHVLSALQTFRLVHNKCLRAPSTSYRRRSLFTDLTIKSAQGCVCAKPSSKPQSSVRGFSFTPGGRHFLFSARWGVAKSHDSIGRGERASSPIQQLQEVLLAPVTLFVRGASWSPPLLDWKKKLVVQKNRVPCVGMPHLAPSYSCTITILR